MESKSDWYAREISGDESWFSELKGTLVCVSSFNGAKVDSVISLLSTEPR